MFIELVGEEKKTVCLMKKDLLIVEYEHLLEIQGTSVWKLNIFIYLLEHYQKKIKSLNISFAYKWHSWPFC